MTELTHAERAAKRNLLRAPDTPQTPVVATSGDLREVLSYLEEDLSYIATPVASGTGSLAQRTFWFIEALSAIEQDPELPHLITDALHAGNDTEKKIALALLSLIPTLSQRPE